MTKYSWLRVWLLLALLGMMPGACSTTAPAAGGSAAQQALQTRQAPTRAAPQGPELSVTVSYTQEDGALDKVRLLNGAQGGYAPMAHLGWLPAAYADLAALGIQSIRLDHLTNDAFYRVVSRGADGQLVFDFSRLDAVLLPMFEYGIQPFLCLSYAPQALVGDGAMNAPLPNLDEWALVVRAYVQHLLDLGHSGLYWEIWNEPDLEVFYQGDEEQYLVMYARSAQAVKAVDPSARVGGPADSNPASPTGRLSPLLNYVRIHPETPLDFVSYHKYGDANGDGLPPFDLEWGYDPVEFAMQFSQIEPREIFVTEWNLTARMDSGAGAPSDSNHLAAGAAVMLYNALKYPNLKRVFYFSMLDGYAPAQTFSGDLGLLTSSQQRKAVANVFQMISWLGDTRLKTEISGEHSGRSASYALATRGADGQAAVLVWNYSDQPALLHLSIEDLPFSAPDTALEMRRYQVDEHNGNYYPDYTAGLRGDPLGPGEALLPLEQVSLAPADTFTRDATLPPYSVALYVVGLKGTLLQTSLPQFEQQSAPRNLAAGRAVKVSSALAASDWSPSGALDEVVFSLPGAVGWSSALSPRMESAEWIEIDLGQAVQVSRVVLYARDDVGHEGDGFPADFILQGAQQPGQWSDLVVRSGYSARPGAQEFRFSPGSYRYIRLLATRLGKLLGRPGEFCMQLSEIQVFDK